MGKKRKREAGGEGEGGAPAGKRGGAKADKESPNKKGKWKPVELSMDLLKDFEAQGGFMFEEADDDVGVAYANGKTWTFQNKQGKAKQRKADAKEAKKQTKGEEHKEADLKEENKRLRKELAELKKAKGLKGTDGKTKQKQQQEKGKEEKATAPQSGSKETKYQGSPSAGSGAPVAVKEPLPLSALADWSEFDLHPKIIANIARLHFKSPTEVQRRCLIPAIRQRKDLIGAAETGSGKTLAFGLPILHHILSAEDGGIVAGEGGDAPAARAKRKLSAIAVLPTRELAVQVKNHISAAAQGTDVRVECVVGGMSLQKQHRLLQRSPRIVVGTPGRLFALLGLNKDAEQERCDWLRSSLVDLRHLVLDEADRLVESGHFKELDQILSLLYSSLPRAEQLQTFVFSATLTLDPRSGKRWRDNDDDDGEHAKLDALISRLQLREARAVHVVDLTHPEDEVDNGKAGKVESQRTARLPKGLEFCQVTCDSDKDRENKLAVWLLHRYRWHAMTPKETVRAMRGAPELPDEEQGRSSGSSKKSGRVIIFTNAVSAVMRLAPVLALLMESPSAESVLAKVGMTYDKSRGVPPGGKVEVIGLHSKLRQKDRLKRIDRFRASKSAVLVCTDVAARGLDVPEVAAVLHYQPPRNVDVYVHRSGRTARAGREGDSVAFASPADLGQWSRIYRALGIDRSEVDEFPIGAFDMPVAREAMRLAGALESKVHRSSKDANDVSWFRRTAEEADLILDEDPDDKDSAKPKAAKKVFWGLYQQLLDRVRWLPKQLGAAPFRKKGRLQKVKNIKGKGKKKRR